jgi:mannitol 2-dehydrogenase
MNTGEGAGLEHLRRRPAHRRPPARDDLAEQDYLFTLFELGDSDDTEVRVIGSISDMLLAEDGAQALIDKLASPQIRIVSLTITEGGYCIDDSNGEFMAHLPQIQHDLAHPHAPRTCSAFCAALKNAVPRAPRRLPSCPAITCRTTAR